MNVKTMHRFSKHVQGWQAGAVIVLAALLAALLAVPRPVALDEVPMPRPDMRVLAALSEADRARADAISQQRPVYDVRALGEAIRSYGVADAAADPQAGARLEILLRAVPPALQAGQEALLSLRAYQMQLFLEHVAAFARTGQETDELRELGGGVIPMLRRSGWVRRQGHGYVVLPDRFALEILFRKRWNELTGLKDQPFALTLHEHRKLAAFFLAHPSVTSSAEDPLVRCRMADEYRLKKILELAAVDKEYPADLARGILLARLRRPKQAVDALVLHIEKNPDGAYALRARNALRYAQEQLFEAIDQ